MDEIRYDILPLILRVESVQTSSLKNDGIRICATGGRDYKETRLTRERLTRLNFLETIREIGVGCATGLDSDVLKWAEDNDISYRRYVADWDTIGLSAGCLRNGVMLEDFQPDKLLVFPGGVGTTDCARKARKMGIHRDFYDDDTDVFLAAKKWG